MIVPIIQVGDPILHQVAGEVCFPLDTHHSILIENLKDTLESTGRGVGLAAPQLGESVRIFLIHPRPTANYPDQVDEGVIVVINPKIIGSSTEVISGYEGCLSISSQNGPGLLRAEVPRSQRIEVTYLDESGNTHQRRFGGFASVIFQHEYDHLEGVLFLSRVENWKSLKSDR